MYTYAYTHNGILLVHVRYEILPFAATWVHLKEIILGEISQMEKDKNCMIVLILNIKQTNKAKPNSVADNKLVVTKGEGL